MPALEKTLKTLFPQLTNFNPTDTFQLSKFGGKLSEVAFTM